MLSIIIPTINEEEYLPNLLESIKKQHLESCVVIVADAGSKDKTVEIAQRYGCTIIEGGLPAKGRNNGAKVARGELLFFLDADTILPDRFFEKALFEFNARKLGVASFCLRPYPKNRAMYFLVDIFYNKPIVLLERVLPHAAMGIFIKKALFDNIHGFDEEITLAEDHDLARRAARHGKFGIIRSVDIFASDRRSLKDGWLKTGMKYFLCELYTIFIGPVKSDIFNYKFNHYKK